MSAEDHRGCRQCCWFYLHSNVTLESVEIECDEILMKQVNAVDMWNTSTCVIHEGNRGKTKLPHFRSASVWNTLTNQTSFNAVLTN